MTQESRIVSGGEIEISSNVVDTRLPNIPDLQVVPTEKQPVDNSLPHKIADVLREKQIDIGYDPDNLECKTSYGMKLNIVYTASGSHSEAKLFKRKLTIDTNQLKSNEPASIDKITARLLHEKTHLDIAPIESPAAVGSLYLLFQSIDDPVKASLTVATAALAYGVVVRELVVEGINYARYKFNILTAK